MNQNETMMRHTLAALVTNEPGVLANVAGMFAARGFNIDSLVVGRTENPELSRMTIVVNGSEAVLEQVRKQLQKLVPVVKVVDYKDTSFVERDLMLIQVSTAQPGEEDTTINRSKLVELAQIFRAKVVDVGTDRLLLELSGTEEKIEAFIELVRPYGILELARTGVIAMPRGMASRFVRGSTSVKANESAGSATAPDVGDLPPG